MSKVKRKPLDHGGGRQDKSHLGKRRKVSSDDDSYSNDSAFCTLLSECKYSMKKGGKYNEIGVDQAVCQRNLLLAIKRHSNYPQVVEEFLEGFSEYIEDSSRFQYSLLPTNTVTMITDTEHDSSRSGSQDSLVRILLGVDIIQAQLMNTLLEKLPEFMGDEDYMFLHGQKVNVPRLLMSQFRWLDRIINSKEVTQKMLEMIGISSEEVQREIITSLPEVVEDSEHGEVARSLSEMLVQNKQLTVPILDALSNLALKPELVSEVRANVLLTLASVAIEDLPVVIKFLLQSATPQDALEVVSEIRGSLDFKSSLQSARGSSQHNAQGRNRERNGSPGDTETLVLDAIKCGVRFQKSVAEAWMKAIDAVKLPSEHKVIDIFIMLILHSTNRKKAVESLCRNKIRSGGFTEALLQTAFCAHGQVLREFFPSILSLSEVLLRSPEPGVTYFACAMYRNAFTAFDSYCQQEIVGNLITHIGSGFEGEIDSSLDILADLVQNHLGKMAPFAIFVKGVLDYLDNLTVTQIRKLYCMLSTLAFQNPQEGGLIQDDLHIIIRKQLSHNDPKYKKMGVIGAIMVVKSIASKSPTSENASDGSVLTEDHYRQVVNLLQLVRTSSNRMPEATALFMDELSSVLEKGELAPKVELWISENVITDFQEDFVVDIEEEKLKEPSLVSMALLYGLDDESEGGIAINLLPLVIQNSADRRKAVDSSSKFADPVCISPHFRLLRTSEQRQQDGDLENIDALLGCPLYGVEEEQLEKIESLSQKEREVMCTSLFHSINWFTEVVNGFGTQSDPEMKGKVITRLHNITQLQNLLEKCLAATPGFKPPPANFDWDDCPIPSAISAPTAAKGKKKGRKKGKKKQADTGREDSDENSQDGNSTMLQETQKSQSETQSPDKLTGDTQMTVSLSSYRPFFRELDINVFQILNTGLITKAALDTDMNTKATTELTIQPPQLEFLLLDFTRKLSHSLLASASKRRTFLKTRGDKNIGFSHLDRYSPKKIARKAVKLLPALCGHLEGASGFFQALIAENDGLIDGPGSSSPQAHLIGSCFQLLLQAFLSIFSWNGFLMTANRELLQEALTVLVSRIKSAGSTQLGYQDLLRTSFQYVHNFSSTVPSLTTSVTLIKLLVTLAEKSDSTQLSTKIAKLAEEFLQREWLGPDGEREKGAKHNESLQVVVKTYLVYTEDPLEAAEKITTKGIPELLEAEKNGCSNTYPTLTRSSFAVFYRAIFIELVECAKTLSPGKQSDTRQAKLDRLLRWNLAVRILHILINLTKAFDGRTNLGSALKYGRQFLEIFLRQGMPLMDSMFKAHREDVQGLLKNLQLSTRAMHHVCGHSKIIRDIALTNQVPLLKKCLESFVYRVKAMLNLNKCLEAFWLGNLKNRDLQGEEILSQASTAADSTANGGDSDEDTTVPDDEDEESDVELDQRSEASDETKDEGSDGEGSYSEVY